MKLYPENYAVEVTVPFVDLNGSAIVPSAVRAKLYDGEDELIVDFGSMPFTGSDGEKVVAIAAAFNVLAEGELKAARVLRVELEVPAGIIRKTFSYLIEGEFRLELVTNTFMTYEAAEMIALDTSATAGWAAADEERRMGALIEAHSRLSRIPMKYDVVLETHPYKEEHVMLPADWEEVSPDDFRLLPTAFRKALRRAQFCEANELLEGDEMGKRQRMGVISETIGESSVMLRGGQLQLGISTQTLNHLRGFVYYNLRIARA